MNMGSLTDVAAEVVSQVANRNVVIFLYLCKVLKAVPNAFGIAFSLLAAEGGFLPKRGAAGGDDGEGRLY
jgi:hypothetical protein